MLEWKKRIILILVYLVGVPKIFCRPGKFCLWVSFSKTSNFTVLNWKIVFHDTILAKLKFFWWDNPEIIFFLKSYASNPLKNTIKTWVWITIHLLYHYQPQCSVLCVDSLKYCYLIVNFCLQRALQLNS